MFNKKSIIILAVVFSTVGIVSAQGLESDWNDFLHYTAIGRLDLAEGFARKIIDAPADPVELLSVVERASVMSYKAPDDPMYFKDAKCEYLVHIITIGD